MQAGRNLSIIVHIVANARKNPVLRDTGGVRAYRGISRISHNMPQQLQLGFLSKNALLLNILYITAPCIQVERHLPAT